MSKEDCKHEHLDLAQGMSGWESPYDGTDEWWEISCRDCEAVLAEGDGYSSPPKSLMEKVVA